MSSSRCCWGSSHSNLERFLQCVTPVVPSQTLPQSCFNGLNSLWQPLGKDTIEYFTLKDLWDCYEQWSAYGVGAPVMLSCVETATQHYVPYLSAIQIYTGKSVAASRFRREDSDGVEFESDSWSDDSGSDGLSRSLSYNSSKTWDVVSEDSCCDQEGSCPSRDKIGYLYLQYTETTTPYCRVPFTEKISELARSHPALMTLKSVDLSPASWMAVAWYPIYSIPTGKNEKDLAACFITYHTLSSSFQDTGMEYEDIDIGKYVCCKEELGSIVGKNLKKKENDYISQPPFGLASYKMNNDIWLNQESADHERVSYLQSAADSWLKQLNFNHHDFNFFTFHSSL